MHCAHLDTSAHIVLGGRHWDGVPCDVQPILLALLRDIWEMLQNLLAGLVAAGTKPTIR